MYCLQCSVQIRARLAAALCSNSHYAGQAMSDAFTKTVQAGDYTKLVADALQAAKPHCEYGQCQKEARVNLCMEHWKEHLANVQSESERK